MDAHCENTKKEAGHWGEGKDGQTNDPLSGNVLALLWFLRTCCPSGPPLACRLLSPLSDPSFLAYTPDLSPDRGWGGVLSRLSKGQTP